MKRILISLIFTLFSFICFAQLPDEVKHIEFISEPTDTMFVLNKNDVDKINTAFYKLECADSLNIVNDKIITALSIESSKLYNIISEQRIIIENKDIEINQIITENKEVISDLEKQLKRANVGRIF